MHLFPACEKRAVTRQRESIPHSTAVVWFFAIISIGVLLITWAYNSGIKIWTMGKFIREDFAKFYLLFYLLFLD